VLDSSILELETHISFPDSKPNPKLIQTIANQSPLLEKLTIDFREMGTGREPAEKMLEKLIKPIIYSLNSIKHLTCLRLYNLGQSYRSVLSLIGKSCPLLSHLSVSGFHPGKRDIFAIIMGDVVDNLRPALSFDDPFSIKKNKQPTCLEDDFLQGLKVPTEFLTPLCFTLKDLQLSNSNRKKKESRYVSSRLGYDRFEFSSSLVAFALRHFPRLEKMDENVPTSEAIRLLYNVELVTKTKDSNLTTRQEEFEDACQKAAGNHRKLKSTATSQCVLY